MPKTKTPDRALKIIEKEKEDKTGVLTLGNCGLNYIPDEISEMRWLTVLDIGRHYSWSKERKNWRHSYRQKMPNNLIELPQWLSKLSGLKHIGLNVSGANNLHSLSELVGLESLNIEGLNTQIKDLSSFNDLKKISSLTLHGKLKSNLSVLSSLPKLTSLSLNCESSSGVHLPAQIKYLSIQIQNPGQLELIPQLQQLQKLQLTGDEVNNLEIMKHLPKLQDLSLDRTKIVDLSQLANLFCLESLSCINTNVKDLSPLSGLLELKTINMSDTQVTDLTPLASLTNLQTLIFTDTEINDLLPISGLSNLQNLDCDKTKITTLKPLSSLTKLQKLDFQETKINDLGPISNLICLEALLCINTHVSDLSPLTRLHNLQKLDCDGTHVENLSPLSKLSNLKEISFNNTQVSNLEPLSSLSKLTNLGCSNTKLTDLSPLSGLPALKFIFCNNNQISNLGNLSDLPNLQLLICSGTQIRDLDALSNIPSLKYLDCTNTLVSSLNSLSNLTNLESLSCGDTKINDLSPLSGLLQLSSLNVNKTQISSLNPLSSNPNLESLGLDNTHIQDLKALSSLNKLSFLSCSKTNVRDLNPIAKLPSLEYLSCQKAQVTDLSPMQNFLRSAYTDFDCSGCPLILPPVEFADSDKQVITEYFDELEGGQNPLNEVKIIFLGEGASGKTSLIKRLRDEPFDDDESQTHGIRIRPTPYEIEDETVMANLWDFGGQEVMHATHQFFLSKRCIYVLVLNSRTDDKAEYWLKHANSFGGNSPVLVVLNKIDENPSFQVNSKVLSEKYPQIKGYHRLSCKTDKGIEDLKAALAEQISLSDTRRTPFPDTWRGVKQCFTAMDKDYIETAIFHEICKHNGVEKPFSQRVLLQFLHDLGIVINFKRLKNFDTQILNPLWLTNGVYRVINSPLIADQKGLFEELDFDKIINDPRYEDGNTTEKRVRYPLDKLQYIIRVMQEFELCFQLDQNRYIIPQLLPVEEPDFDLEGATINFVINFPEFLPDSIFPRLMVKLHDLIKGNLRWRSGMVLKQSLLFGETSARVRSDKEDKQISIDACGENPRRLMSYIRETLKEIIEAFADLQYEEMLRIPDSEVFLSYGELVDLESMKVDDYPVGKLKKTVSVSELLNGVEEASMRGDESKTEVKAFLSYAHLDVDEKDRLRAALSPLERLNKLSIWDDHAIDAGEEWEKEIFEQLEKAEIVLCLISPDFINSDFCHQRELSQALEAHSRGDKVVVPIQLRECDWDELPISRLQGIPGDWIMSAKNQDKARAKVSKKLRKTIEHVKEKRKDRTHGI